MAQKSFDERIREIEEMFKKMKGREEVEEDKLAEIKEKVERAIQDARKEALLKKYEIEKFIDEHPLVLLSAGFVAGVVFATMLCSKRREK